MELHERVRKMEAELERLRFDHGFLVAVLDEMAVKLECTGKLEAGDRHVFNYREPYEPDMPTLLELLRGYVTERENGKIPA